VTQFYTAARALNRPKLLITAAGLAAKKYRRNYHLKALSQGSANKDETKFFQTLIEQENDLEWTRRSGSANYDVFRHITLLAAIIAEARREVHAPLPIRQSA